MAWVYLFGYILGVFRTELCLLSMAAVNLVKSTMSYTYSMGFKSGELLFCCYKSSLLRKRGDHRWVLMVCNKICRLWSLQISKQLTSLQSHHKIARLLFLPGLIHRYIWFSTYTQELELWPDNIASVILKISDVLRLRLSAVTDVAASIMIPLLVDDYKTALHGMQ